MCLCSHNAAAHNGCNVREFVAGEVEKFNVVDVTCIIYTVYMIALFSGRIAGVAQKSCPIMIQ